MPSRRLICSLLLAAVLLVSCDRLGDHSLVVASVYDRELLESDLEGLVAAGVSPEDSVTIINNYVDQWIRQQVLLAKAKKNVKDDFARELQEYKNSLTIYAYERQIIDQLLDTNVTREQIEEYYSQHSADFTLKSSIVKSAYVVLPYNSPLLSKFKAIVDRPHFGERDVMEMESLASRNGIHGFFDIDTWQPFYSLQAMVPIATYNDKLFLKSNRSVALTDDTLTYVVRIIDYKVSDEVSPLEVQVDNIRAILLNRRKIELLKSLHADLLKEAETGGHVKRYSKNN